jgi:hypothetical protein
MFNLEVMLKDLKKQAKKNRIFLGLDQDSYYFSNSYYIVRVARSYLSDKFLNQVKEVFKSLDNISIINGNVKVLDTNILKNLLDSHNRGLFELALDTKILIDQDQGIFKRLFYNELNNKGLLVDNEFYKIFSSNDPVYTQNNNLLLKQEKGFNTMILLGFKTFDKNRLPILLKDIDFTN